jgi:hypothetical protein
MRTQIAKQRKDNDGEPISGWDAAILPNYEPLRLVLKELEGVEQRDGVAEMGADYNDEDDDGLSIVWANYAYFTDGDGSLRDMYAWVAVDGDHYFGCNLDGEEFTVPLADPNTAAKKLLADAMV